MGEVVYAIEYRYLFLVSFYLDIFAVYQEYATTSVAVFSGDVCAVWEFL
jgi:hypothetical protein